MPDSGSPQGFSAGDVYVQFIGDMTQLDKSVDSLGPRIQSGMAGAEAATERFGDSLDEAGEKAEEAGEEIQDSMQKADFSMREARGTAMLLGEEIGVHMNRHVAGFVASLPGVGEAMATAFSAVAVIALIEVLVKGTEKLTDWINTTFIYTEAAQQMDAALRKSNQTHDEANKELAKIKKAYEDSINPTKAAQRAHEDLKAAVAAEEAEIKKLQNTAAVAAVAIESWWDKTVNFTLGAIDKITGSNLLQAHLMQQQLDANKAAQVAQNNELIALQDKHNKDSELLREADKTAEIKAIKAKGDEQFRYWRETQNVYEGLIAENEKLEASNAKLLDSFKKTFNEMNKSEMVDKDNPMTLHMRDLSKALQDARTHVKALEQDIAPFAQDFNSAFIAAASGAESWAKAMEGAAGRAITSLGQYAQVQAIASFAKGLAEWWNGDAASHDFAAAAMWEAASLAAGIGGAMMSGGGSGGSGGGGGSYSGTGTRGNVTSGSGTAPGPASTTTRLAAGGLITSPIPVIVGDSASGGSANEAVLPLDHPESMAKIAGAIAPHIAAMLGGGGGHTFHMNVKGMISDSDTRKLTKKISKMVKASTATLHSSNSLRVTKRSQ